MGFNRDIVECKVVRKDTQGRGGLRFNRDIVECKGKPFNCILKPETTVLIET